MKRIIHIGSVYPPITDHFTNFICQECRCEFEVDDEELIWDKYLDRYTTDCPCCGTRIVPFC